MFRSSAPTGYGRFALFIDGSNLYHTLRDLKLHVDYRRLLEYFSANGTLIRACYYMALLEGSQTPDWLIRLTDWVAYNSYAVNTKRAKVVRRQARDEQGALHWIDEIKGDVDIELAVNMLALAPHCDTIFLFSGDGDFVRVIQAVQQLGCRVVVLSSEKTSDSTVADELRRQADQFIEITSIADHICMLDRTT